MFGLTDDELAALRRIETRLEADLEEYGDTDKPSVALVEEEVELVRYLIGRFEGGES